jgi:hypothetical protein
MHGALKFVLFAVICAGCLWQSVPAGAAEVYKWKDGNRVTTYSQLPPAHGVQVQRLRTTTSEARPAAAAPGATSAAATPPATGTVDAPTPTPAQQEMRARLDAEEKARLSQLASQRQTQCQAARAQFDQLTQYARMRVQDDAGNVRVMPEEERQRRIQEAKARIVEYCAS